MSLLNEYISKRLSGIELEAELLRLIHEYNMKKEAFLFIYSGAFNKPIPDAAINMDDYYIIYDMLRKSENKSLDIYIETPGGSGEAVEEIVRFFRSKFEKVSFVISGEAKSAGTIMVLSGDEIYMTESGSLGPVDAQIRIGRTVVSGYDYMEWVEEKREEAEKFGKLNPFDATMVAQISPGELNGVHHALHFAKDLIIQWLPKYKFKDWDVSETTRKIISQEIKEQRASEIADELVNHSKWRSHGRSIKFKDLQDLLRIHRVDDDPEIADIVYRIQTVIRLLFFSSTTYKIFATDKDKIFRQAVQAGSAVTFPQKKVDAVEFNIKCPKCGEENKFYGKFVEDPQLDKNMQANGKNPIPDSKKHKCKCSFEIDLSGIINDIETKIGRKLI